MDSSASPQKPPGSLRRLKNLVFRHKYECLLVALLQHLFSAVFLPDLGLYTNVAWPINMMVLGVFSVGVFAGVGRTHLAYRNLLAGLVLVMAILPTLPWLISSQRTYMLVLSGVYFLFFAVIFIRVLRYLLRPSYIDFDIVVAAVCGHLLLLETGSFLLQGLYYAVPHSLSGVDTQSFASTYIDIVYFSSITLTSIGFGDIVPVHHITKLATAALGLTGQMYSVVLVGILISKYTSHPKPPAP